MNIFLHQGGYVTGIMNLSFCKIISKSWGQILIFRKCLTMAQLTSGSPSGSRNFETDSSIFAPIGNIGGVCLGRGQHSPSALIKGNLITNKVLMFE